MDDGTDGWMEKASQPRRPLLHVIAHTLGIGHDVHTKIAQHHVLLVSSLLLHFEFLDFAFGKVRVEWC
jgi:hypothetical protein